MLYERDAKDELVYSKDKFIKDELSYTGEVDYIQYLFNEVKRTYSTDGLFETEDKIRIRRESFLLILEELSSVELYDTSDDIKGIAFELFLGKNIRGGIKTVVYSSKVVEFFVGGVHYGGGCVIKCGALWGLEDFFNKKFLN